MQGILKSNHQRLCDCLQDMKVMQLVPDHILNDMEADLQSVFLSYQEKMKELKRLVIIYEEKEKLIRNQIKRIRKNNITEVKKKQ